MSYGFFAFMGLIAIMVALSPVLVAVGVTGAAVSEERGGLWWRVPIAGVCFAIVPLFISALQNTFADGNWDLLNAESIGLFGWYILATTTGILMMAMFIGRRGPFAFVPKTNAGAGFAFVVSAILVAAAYFGVLAARIPLGVYSFTVGSDSWISTYWCSTLECGAWSDPLNFSGLLLIFMALGMESYRNLRDA